MVDNMNIYSPPLTDKQMKEYESWEALEINLKSLCKWVDFRDYIWGYGRLNYKGKVVLDIGADIGSSALYFISKGARRVAIIENNPEYNEIYRKLKKEMPEMAKVELINREDVWKVDADILKMDCEGCEVQFLSEDNIKNLKRYGQFAIALHRHTIGDIKFNQLFNTLGSYKGFYFGTVNSEEYMFIKELDE